MHNSEVKGHCHRCQASWCFIEKRKMFKTESPCCGVDMDAASKNYKLFFLRYNNGPTQPTSYPKNFQDLIFQSVYLGSKV